MKDIFFLDMDDTLLDFRRLEKETLLRTLAFCGIRAGEEAASRFHDINAELWKMLERGAVTRPQIVKRRFEILLRELGAEADVQTLADYYARKLAQRCYPFEGMEKFLRELRSRGEIYITTNGASVIQRKHLLDGGIASYMDGAFISDEIGYNKPSYDYVRYVLSRVPSFAAHRAVYIGDSLTSDKVCAERMGVDFILFAPHVFPKNYPDMIARTYFDVLEIMDCL